MSLSRFFDFESRGTSLAVEARGAVATFLTMAYILFANPTILAAAGVPFDAAVAGTAAAAGLCSVLTGLGANFPLALASGMGLNAVVAFQIAPAAGSWQTAMGLVVLDGLLMLVLVVSGFREAAMDAIPRDLRRAVGVGIGLFIAFIGAVNAKLVIVPASTITALAQHPQAVMPPVTFGNPTAPEARIALAGLFLTAVLLARRVRGAIVIGILGGAVLAAATGVADRPLQPHLPSFALLFQADVRGALRLDLVPLLLALLMVDFFDTLGTATAIAEQAELTDRRGRILGIRRVLIVDSLAAAIGGLFGVSSVTAYVESAAGVAEGARTGLHSVIVGLLFFAAILAAPLAALVPAAATAPALILVGFLMCTQIGRIDFSALDTAIPAFVTLLTLPFTYSIAHGIGYGFITFVAIKMLSAKAREVHPVMYILTAAFAADFVWGH